MITKIRLAESIPGFFDEAEFKHPCKDDCYISSTTGEPEEWRHSEPGKHKKIVLKKKIKLDVTSLPTGMLVRRPGCEMHFLSNGVNSKYCELSPVWQANQWRNCPFKRGTVKIKYKSFSGPRSGILNESMIVDPRDIVNWEDVAQFIVLGLAKGVGYVTESTGRIPLFYPV